MAAKRRPSSVAVLRRVDKERKTISSCSPPRPLALNISAASLQCYPMTSFLSEKIFTTDGHGVKPRGGHAAIRGFIRMGKRGAQCLTRIARIIAN